MTREPISSSTVVVTHETKFLAVQVGLVRRQERTLTRDRLNAEERSALVREARLSMERMISIVEAG